MPPDTVALANHATHVLKAAGDPERDPGNVNLDGIIAPNVIPGPAGAAAGVARHHCPPVSEGPRDLMTASEIPVPSQGEYLATVQDGARLLQRNPALAGTVFTLDFGNPFNAVLSRPPVVGGNHWNHVLHNFSLEKHLPADQAFGDASIIMVPRRPSQSMSLDHLGRIYGRYIHSNFVLADRSQCWDVYLRRRAVAS